MTRIGDTAPMDLSPAPDQVTTGPRLVLVAETLESNIAQLSAMLRRQRLGWRPHVKAHLSPALSRHLVDRGAIGVTCATVRQAEHLVAAGIGSVLVATPPCAEEWMILHELQAGAEVIAVIDGPDHVAAARTSGATGVPVLVEVDLGLGRTGARSVAEAVRLAASAEAEESLDLRGFMGYEGHVFRTWPGEAKQRTYDEAMRTLTETVTVARDRGLDVGIVSGGGTGSLGLTPSACLTESQAGGGIFMDETYVHDFHVEGLQPALTIEATVVSRPDPWTAIINAGFKHLGASKRAPGSMLPGLSRIMQSAHASTLDFDRSASQPAPHVGAVVRLIPGYSDAMICNFALIHVEHQGKAAGMLETGYSRDPRC